MLSSPPPQQLLQSLDHVAFSNQVSGEPLELRVQFADPTPNGRRGSYSYRGVDSSTSRAEHINALTRVVNATSADIAIKNNIAPMPVTVNILSPEASKDQADEAEKLHDHLVSASSIAHLYTAILLVNQVVQNGAGSELWNVNEADEAIVALSNTASAAYRAMMGPLMGLYSIKNTTASTYNRTMPRGQVHGRFLDEFLREYGPLPREQLDVLDEVLTDYVRSVGGIPVTPEQQSTVDQVFRVNRVVRVNVSGDDRYPVWVLQPQTRLVHLKINIVTWAQAVQKKNAKRAKSQMEKPDGRPPGPDENVKIAMDITVVDAVLNVEEYLRHRAKFEDIIQTLTGRDLHTFGRSISAESVTSRV
ncbi:uncharacterized protein B0I36DRAFT_351549 [Microdochium trichocladiopsis]|uniref:Uncharacterized protein n=1 Tax=Microdochium trichocladiopsis TaxID=1682393 RepID=A0A9P8Y3C0_9PEZI|nr:uncharacterized protein B0I36DRAFT_351549 [Microdochium trichocladiopsis]KAH7028128.1 hypothetical protein B0I36DRAFT_351549 [Microdochium trichocladiopsis]